MRFYAPKNFKNGNYYLNKYDTVDLFVLVPCIFFGVVICISGIFSILIFKTVIYAVILAIIGGLLILTGILLTITMDIHHNLLGKIKCMIAFHLRQRTYKWFGYDYHNYEDE